MEYMRRPATVEAWQVGSGEEWPSWMAEIWDEGTLFRTGDEYLIKTYDGIFYVDMGDYIFLDERGHLRIYNREMFERTFEPIRPREPYREIPEDTTRSCSEDVLDNRLRKRVEDVSSRITMKTPEGGSWLEEHIGDYMEDIPVYSNYLIYRQYFEDLGYFPEVMRAIYEDCGEDPDFWDDFLESLGYDGDSSDFLKTVRGIVDGYGG